MMKTTKTMKEDLKWFEEHGGDDVLDKYGRLLAQGETTPHNFFTYYKLGIAGKVEFYADGMRVRMPKS